MVWKGNSDVRFTGRIALALTTITCPTDKFVFAITGLTRFYGWPRLMLQNTDADVRFRDLLVFRRVTIAIFSIGKKKNST